MQQVQSLRGPILAFYVIAGLSFASARGQVANLPLPEANSTTKIETSDYGLQDSNYLFIPAVDFKPLESSTGYSVKDVSRSGTLPSVYPTGEGGSFVRSLHLPEGVLLENLRLYFKDTNPSLNVWLYLCNVWVTTDTGRSSGLLCGRSVVSSGSPGHSSLVLTVNETVRSRRNVNFEEELEDIAYVIRVLLPAADNSNSFVGVRAQWRRQVSPAPATPRFSDVPVNHPFYRFIEALAAAGITSGCGGGNFCPDAPLTRGQAAVLLVTALGLHWAP